MRRSITWFDTCRDEPQFLGQCGLRSAAHLYTRCRSACGYAALTRAPDECDVVTAEFKINLLRPAIGERFLAVAKVQNAGKLLTVCTGEVNAFSGSSCKVVAIMQATIVNIPVRQEG